jgi:hypothetical protein
MFYHNCCLNLISYQLLLYSFYIFIICKIFCFGLDDSTIYNANHVEKFTKILFLSPFPTKHRTTGFWILQSGLIWLKSLPTEVLGSSP